MKRLTIVLDEDSEKGFGLVRTSAVRARPPLTRFPDKRTNLALSDLRPPQFGTH